MATWPTTLPAPLLAGYGINPESQTLRTNMEAGNAKTRRMTFAKIDKFPVAFSFSTAELVIFRNWFHDVDGADGGNGWFTISLRTGYQEEKQTVEAKFEGAYSVPEFDGKNWKATGALEVRYA